MQFVFMFHQIASFPLGTVYLKLMFLCILLLNGCIMVRIFVVVVVLSSLFFSRSVTNVTTLT